MTERFLESRGIAYRVSPLLPTQPTLVFIHGLSGSASAWIQFENAFSSYNILTYDLRGHGLSRRHPSYRAYTLAEHVRDLDHLLTHLAIERAIIVGHCFGTMVGTLFAIEHPHRVAALLCFNPLIIPRGARLSLLRGVSRICALLMQVLPRFPHTPRRVDYTRFTYTPDFDLRRIIPDILAMSLHDYLFSLSHLYRALPVRWHAVTSPLLFVQSRNDHFVWYRDVVHVARALPSVKWVELESGAHVLVLNRTRDMIRIIQETLDELRLSASE